MLWPASATRSTKTSTVRAKAQAAYQGVTLRAYIERAIDAAVEADEEEAR